MFKFHMARWVVVGDFWKVVVVVCVGVGMVVVMMFGYSFVTMRGEQDNRKSAAY